MIAEYYGDDTPWIVQCRDGVAQFVANCIHTLNGTPGPDMNAQPLANGGQYTHPARNAEEIKATPAANERQVSNAPRRFRTMDSVETVDQRGELADPVQQPRVGSDADPQRSRIVLPGDPWTI